MYQTCFQCGKHMGTIEPYEDKTEIIGVCKECKTANEAAEHAKKREKQTSKFLLVGGATL